MTTTTDSTAPMTTDQIEHANATGFTPVVFIHGLWLLPSSWDRWAAVFEEAGYTAVTPGWPDDPETVEEAKAHPEVFAHKTVGQVADHYAEVIGQLQKKPAVFGHSFGGLPTQMIAGLGASAIPATCAAGAAAVHDNDGPKPTIVLIHGAFADASGWSGVMTRLQDRGYTVLASANPLRGVAADSAYIASVLATISGPIVLVGHSYGGEVITNAAQGNPNVKALVYIAAFAPDLGETSGGLVAKFPGSMLTPQNLTFRPFPGGVDGYITPSVFREVFAADVPAETPAVMAASQRPGSVTTLSEPSGVPAWKTIPSWYLVASEDHAIPPAAERFMAARMHAHTVEIDSSHAAMVSHPGAVTDLILSAVQAVQ